MFLDGKTKNNKHAKFPQTQRQVYCYSDWNPYRISESREKKFNIHLEVFKSENAKNIFLQEKEKILTYRKMYQRNMFENTVALL